jgi:hypothetical protein
MNGRPTTLRQVAEQSDSLEEFGRHFRDWLHELRLWSSRSKVAAALADEPQRLGRKFAQGDVADAWLAAYAEFIARRIGRPAPAWSEQRARVSLEPWFATDERNPVLRLGALRDSPAPFKNRNLFTPTVDLPLNLRAGRPAKTADEKRRANAERQARFRVRRQAELVRLRDLADEA